MKKMQNIISLGSVICMIAAIMAALTLELPLLYHADFAGDDRVIYYTASYEPDGKVAVWKDLLSFIEQEYSTEAKEAYIQAVQTGDYYQYRSITGFWQPTIKDPKLKAHANSGKANPLYFLNSVAIDDELTVYNYLGAYGTATDYVAICQQYGVVAFSSVYKTGNDAYAQYVEGTMPKTGTKITKQQYLANHSNVATATATSSNSAVEALKTYSGNTSEFNAYTYYTRYADLQSAVGANGDALLKHWQAYGKAEGRIAN